MTNQAELKDFDELKWNSPHNPDACLVPAFPIKLPFFFPQK